MQKENKERTLWQRPLHTIMQACAKPQGRSGRFMLSMMSAGHSPLTDWGLSHLTLARDAFVIDIGCGSGVTIQKLLMLCPEGFVTGLDYSPLSVEQSRKNNKADIQRGRCRIIEGTVASLPFEDNSFDCALAVETIYFWPQNSFGEVYRILKPGGKFLAICEADGTGPTDNFWLEVIDGMTLWTRDELGKQLREAGFAEVEIDTKSVSFGLAHWMCAVAVKCV